MVSKRYTFWKNMNINQEKKHKSLPSKIILCKDIETLLCYLCICVCIFVALDAEKMTDEVLG